VYQQTKDMKKKKWPSIYALVGLNRP